MKRTVLRWALIWTAAAAMLCGAALSFAQDGSWVARAPMPTPRVGSAAAVLGGSLYVVGGGNSTWPSLSQVESYDPGTNAWTTRASIPVSTNGAGAGAIDGILYVVGGGTTNSNGGGQILSTLQAYNPETGTWAMKAPMPTPRGGMGVAVLGGSLYAVGGSDFTTVLNTVEAYDPISNTWTTKAPMPTAREGLALVASGGLLYAIGGFGLASSPHLFAPPLPVVEAYDPETNTWSTRVPMPTPRGNLGAGLIQGVIYAVGGTTTGIPLPVATPALEAYDPITNSWSTETFMPTARAALAVGVIDGVLYAVGGGNDNPGSQFLAVNEALTPFLMVSIDIKPGDRTNTINLGSHGVVPVAILGSATFDPMAVDPTTVTLAGAHVAIRGRGVPMTGQADVNHDGFPDLLLYFRTQDLQLTSSSTEAVLYGATYSGQRIRGSDIVRIVPAGRQTGFTRVSRPRGH